MSDRTQLTAVPQTQQPPSSYAGRTRYTQLEYEAVLANASIGIAFTRDRKFFLCNPKFAGMFGWKPEELIGQTGDVVYPSRESYEALGQIAVPILSAGRQLDLEWEMRRKDGSTFLCRIIAKAIGTAQAQQGTIWIAEDITERRRQADELTRVLREQEATLNTATIGICFVKDRRYVRCNRRMEQMYGYEPGELNGKPTLATYAEPKDHAARADAYQRLEGGQTNSFVVRSRRKDGTVFWERSTGRAVDPEDPGKGSVWLLEDITEQKRAEEELQRVLGEQQALLNNVVVGIAFARDRKVVRCNRRFEELFGYDPGEVLGVSTRQFYFTDEEFARAGADDRELDEGRTHSREHWLRRKDGSGFWCRITGRAVEAGRPEKGYAWLFEDITERRRYDGEVRRLAAEQQHILDNATVGISFVRQRMFQRVNPRLEQMFGCEPGEMLGRSTAIIFPSEEEFEKRGREVRRRLAKGKAYSAELQFQRKDGTLFWCKVVGKAIDPAQPDEGAIWIYDDITEERAAREALQASRDVAEASREALERAVIERTAELQNANRQLEAEIAERKQAETRAQHLADHDVLTGLPNRRLLEDRLTQALALSYRNRKQTAVMFVDLDRFKTINDSLGHAVGDELLKEVAQRLVKQLRIGDTICRIGGDEFVVVLPEIKRSSDGAHVAQKIIETLSQPIAVDERELHVTPSIGISVFPDDGRDAETLIRNADAAMYHAKEMGRANYQFFTEQMNLVATKRLSLENDLRRAMQKDELRVYYQPMSELKTGCVIGHEALLRWQHPSRGLVPPADFIQLAEDTGLILRMGEWVLREACRWANFIGVEHGLLVNVNLSARQFNDPRLVEMVRHVLAESGLPPKLLELEITESTVMQHTDITLATLNKLKELGVSLAIDDFGTGYSSLAYLKRFPVDKLKIDKSFIADVPKDHDDNAIVVAIIGMAHALGMKVVAEGVETEKQMEFLQRAHCDFIQGYLSGAPTDADSAAKEYV